MNTYRVDHTVLCEVHVWRIIEAENYSDALAQVAALETITATQDGADYEIISDKQVISLELSYSDSQ